MITLKRILVPTDFSVSSVPAIGYALSLAKTHDSEVIVLHAVPTESTRERFSDGYAPGGLAAPTEAPMGTISQPDFTGILERKKQVLRTFLAQRISPELLGAVKVSDFIRVGKVVEEIIAAACKIYCRGQATLSVGIRAIILN